MAWIFLIIAAAFEAAWTFSLKFMKFADLKALKINSVTSATGALPVALPFVGYVVFGIGNIYFFSLAIKQLPVATVYAAWTAVTLIFIKFADMTFFGQRITLAETFFMLLIMTGMLGLKYMGSGN